MKKAPANPKKKARPVRGVGKAAPSKAAATEPKAKAYDKRKRKAASATSKGSATVKPSRRRIAAPTPKAEGVRPAKGREAPRKAPERKAASPATASAGPLAPAPSQSVPVVNKAGGRKAASKAKAASVPGAGKAAKAKPAAGKEGGKPDKPKGTTRAPSAQAAPSTVRSRGPAVRKAATPKRKAQGGRAAKPRSASVSTRTPTTAARQPSPPSAAPVPSPGRDTPQALAPAVVPIPRGRKAGAKGKGGVKHRQDADKARAKADKAKAKAKAAAKAQAKRERDATKKAAIRQRKAERKKVAAERRRQAKRDKAEEQRWRELDRREADREKRRADREKNRWEKAVDAKAYKAYLKRLVDIWEPGLKYRLVARFGEPPEETPIRKAAEKRAFREYKKYRANLKRDKDSVKHERLEKEVSMYLRHCFPDWIMEDAIAAGICRLWPMKTRRAVRRNTARWRAHKVWQSLCDMAKHRALVIDAARKRGEKLTREEVAERVIKVYSVQHGAQWVDDENSNQHRRETYGEVYERLLEGSAKGRMAGNPLEDAMIAEEAKLALTESGLNDQELAVMKFLQNGKTREEAAAHFHKTPERISQITGEAAQKISDRLGIPCRLCYFERKKRKSAKDDKKSQSADNKEDKEVKVTRYWMI